MSKFVPSNKRSYAVYYGDRYIYEGSLAEIQEREGISRNSAIWYTTDAARKRNEKTGTSRYLLRVDNLMEEEWWK